MKRNTKGFTLIELLAVIVILAIIALIATPIVLNLIEKARQGAAQDSAYGVRKTAQLYYQTQMIDNIDGVTAAINVDFAGTLPTNFDLDGTKPTKGCLTIGKDGKIVDSVVEINGFDCTITNAGKITCERVDSTAAVACTASGTDSNTQTGE